MAAVKGVEGKVSGSEAGGKHGTGLCQGDGMIFSFSYNTFIISYVNCLLIGASRIFLLGEYGTVQKIQEKPEA